MKTITKEQYYSLIGLRAIAEQNLRDLDKFTEAALVITGEDDDLGHTWDYIMGDRPLKELLELLEIEIQE